eukprot:jgi/Hompol1/1170/HPOL_005523-RA
MFSLIINLLLALMATFAAAVPIAESSQSNHIRRRDPSNSHLYDYRHTAEFDNSYGANGDHVSCEAALRHAHKTRSPTLIKCTSTACAPGQTQEYRFTELAKCKQLELTARENNNGRVPHGW